MTCTVFSLMFTITCCLVVGLGLELGLGLDLVSGCRLLCTRFCSTLGCNCHTAVTVVAVGNRALAVCRIWRRDGVLAVSCAQEGLVRLTSKL